MQTNWLLEQDDSWQRKTIIITFIVLMLIALKQDVSKWVRKVKNILSEIGRPDIRR